MTKYLTGLEIKKKIISALKEGSISLRKLETRLNVGYNSIKRHCEELAYLNLLTLRTVQEGSKNGRDYILVTLTDNGRKLKV